MVDTELETSIPKADEADAKAVEPGFAAPPKVRVQRRDGEPLLRGAELSARARLEQLFDAGTFVEIDARVQHRAKHFGMLERSLPGDGVVTGFGTIGGQTVYAYSQDRAVLGGSLGEAHAHKIGKIIDMAGKGGCPVVQINDSGGARIQEGVEALAGYGEIFRGNVRFSGVIPQISLIMGPSAGGAVYSPALTDFVIMVDQKSYMFVTGPKVVRAVNHEDVTSETLGGGRVHATASGVAHFLVGGEVEALELARRLLSYLPPNNCVSPPVQDTGDPEWRSVEELERLVPVQANRPYDVREVIRSIVDQGSFLEVRALFAPNVCVGLARLGGHPIGVVANNPAVLAGCLDIDASRKAARFVRTCNAFGLPILSLIDVPGFLPGREQEHRGIIDHGAKLCYAYCEATVPKLSVILRKAYGGAYIVMSSKHVGGDFNFAWPKAEIAVMGAAGAVEILFGRELGAAADPPARGKELTDAYTANFCTTQIAEERGYIDAVLEPRDTRRALCRALAAVRGKREELPYKRNGNVPL